MEIILAWSNKFINSLSYLNTKFVYIFITCLNSIKLILRLSFKIFLLTYKFTKQVIFGIKVKLLVKVLCLSVLFYGEIEVTKEYFSYPYVYRLSVKPSERLDLPPITICTERDIIFDKQRINNYFNISNEYESYKLIAFYLTTNSINNCNQNKRQLNWLFCQYVENIRNYYLNKFYEKYNIKLKSNFSFNELYNNFTTKSSELIHCSAKLHLKDKTNNNSNNSSDSQVITDCSQSYAVLETIYRNKDFGICFTYFYTNSDNQYLIGDDFIEFDINYETQQKYLINGYFETYNTKRLDMRIYEELVVPKRKLYFDDYFGLNLFVNQLNKPLMESKGEWIHTNRIGLNARLKITTTHFHLLSNPYMKRCHKNGNSNIFLFYYLNKYLFNLFRF